MKPNSSEARGRVRWDDLAVFLVLARHLHFGQAAVELHVSQAQVSRRLQALEKSLGVVLVRRTTRTVALTPEGLRLLGGLEGVESTLRAITDAGPPPPGPADEGGGQ